MSYEGAQVSTGVGLRHVRVSLRDTDGLIEIPAGTAIGTAYNGLRIGGALALTITLPDPQRVIARGDDRAYYTFQLPPTEGPTGELRVTKTSFDVIALLTSTKKFGSPPVRKVGVATDKQGEEPQLVMWGSRRAIDSTEESDYFGQQVWQTYLLINALASLRPAAMEDAAIGEFIYSVAANDAAVDEFGTDFTEGVHGFTLCPYIMIVTVGKYMLDAFLGDNAQVAFTLSQVTPSSGQPVTVAVDGVIQTDPGQYSVATNVVTFVAAPALGAKIIVEYEYD